MVLIKSRDNQELKEAENMAGGKFVRFLLFLLAVFACSIQANGKESLASVVLGSDGKTLVIKPGYDSSQPMVAWGKYREEINSTG